MPIEKSPVFCPEKTSEKCPIPRDESRDVFGLLAGVMVADVAAMRARLSADIPADISPKLVPTLLHLARRGGTPMTVGDLAEGLGVSLGWASRVADEMVSIGFLNRIRQNRDRRVVQLHLTERGIELGERLWLYREGAIAAALGEASPNERQVISQFLRRLTAELELRTSKAGSRSPMTHPSSRGSINNSGPH
jgi:DNA-binding MarR family transcriptional regulator